MMDKRINNNHAISQKRPLKDEKTQPQIKAHNLVNLGRALQIFIIILSLLSRLH